MLPKWAPHMVYLLENNFLPSQCSVPCGVMIKALGSGIIVRELELQLLLFRSLSDNALRKCMNPILG